MSSVYFSDRSTEMKSAFEKRRTCLAEMCVYSEWLGAGPVPARSAREMKFSHKIGKESVYVGDIDGDGLNDRFTGYLFPRQTARGQIEFGAAGGRFTSTLPSRFRNLSGNSIAGGQDVTIRSPYDQSASRDKVVKFELSFENYGSRTDSEILYVTVNALVHSGVNFFYNIDQLAPL